MATLSYLTLQAPAQGVYKEKGSKFISFAYPVSSEADIKNKIQILKKEYFDAHHHCYAWMLGPEKQKFRAADDGEPNHSAGDPILGQIRSRGITNVLVVVVRYFGGVKLGVGGLVSAYKLAAEDALSKATVITVEITEMAQLVFDYAMISEVMKIVREQDLTITHQGFDNESRIKILVPLKQKERLIQKLSMIKASGRILSWEFEGDK